jgi:hypothetical protein
MAIGCTDPGRVPTPVYPDGPILGPNGPKPMSGWDVVEKSGIIDGGDYHNTGGEWYIVKEDSAFVRCQASQVYLKRDPLNSGRYEWFLYEQYRVSDRFIYIEDPMRAYNGFGFVIFIYTDYTGS